MPSRRRSALPPKSPMQWSDMSSDAQRLVGENVREQGMARSRVGTQIDRALTAQHAPTNSWGTRDKSRKAVDKLTRIAGHLEDRPITLQGAASRRSRLYSQGSQRAAGEGLGAPRGHGWYFGHHADVTAAADAYGVPHDVAITASAVMSPQNSPENEKAAAGALMKLHHEDPELRFTREGARAIGVKRTTQPIHFSDLSSEQASQLGSLGTHVSAEGHDFTDVARAGTSTNARKAIDVLRGHTPVDEAINPHTAAKVWSYRENIRNAIPNSPTHDEYVGRMRDVQDPAQGRLDLHGLKASEEGILNPHGHTAEDTWMNAVTHGQDLRPVGRTSIGKEVGSIKANYGVGRTREGVRTDLPTEVSDPALKHAYNNEATIRAAAHTSRHADTALPATAMQEVSWTEGRIQAGKDPAYNAEMEDAGRALRAPTVPRQQGFLDAHDQVRSAAKPPASYMIPRLF